MEKLIHALGMLLFVVLLLGIQPSYAGLYGGAWQPDPNEDLFDISVDLISNPNGFEFYLYDVDNSPNVLEDLLLLDSSNWQATTSIENVGGNYIATNRDTGKAINLGASDWFGLYFYDPVTTMLYDEYDLTKEGVDCFKLAKAINSNSWTVYQHDANPVPIPGAVWLMGSALLGLAGIRLRK